MRTRIGLALVLLGAISCGKSSTDGEPSRTSGTAPPHGPRPLPPELREVMRAVEAQRHDLAQELARRFAAARPEDGQACFFLGMTYYWTENYGAARPWLARALELDPDITIGHDFLAHSLFMLGDLIGARREYQAALEITPAEPKTRYGLGLVELEEARLDEAATRFREAIELFEVLRGKDPALVAARQSELAECHARLADVHFARADYEAARAELVQATAISPGVISSFYTLSLVHRRLGEDELAERAAERYESARQAILAGQAGAVGR